MFLFYKENGQFFLQFKETPARITPRESANFYVVGEPHVVGAEIFAKQLDEPNIQGRSFDEIYDSDYLVQAG